MCSITLAVSLLRDAELEAWSRQWKTSHYIEARSFQRLGEALIKGILSIRDQDYVPANEPPFRQTPGQQFPHDGAICAQRYEAQAGEEKTAAAR